MKLFTSFPTRISAKLGRCARCSRISLVGSLVGWGLVAVLSLLWPNPLALLAALLTAVSLTVLTVSHLSTSAVPVAAALKATRDSGLIERREYLIQLFKISAGTFFAVALGRATWANPLSRDELCLPVGADSKPKEDPRRKLNTFLQNNRVPSVLAGAIFQMARRSQMGLPPANFLETLAFQTFGQLSGLARGLMRCSVQRFEALSRNDRRRLFGDRYADLDDRPIGLPLLTRNLAQELLDRASILTYGHVNASNTERPGRPRPQTRLTTGGPSTFFTPTICKIFPPTTEKPDGFRTNTFVRPFFADSSYNPNLTLVEYQQGGDLEVVCTLEESGELNCRNVISEPSMPCPGNTIEGVCLRVPEFRPGDVVKLEGFNFFNVDAKVRLVGRMSGLTIVLEAHVWGDIATPITETIDRVERTILDCRVKDVITFLLPEDLADDIYGFQVIVPNNTGSGTALEYRSEGEQFIRVLASLNTTFQIATEQLFCIDETDSGIPGFINKGSDEVRINIGITTIDVDPATMTKTLSRQNIYRFKFNELDSGNAPAMEQVLLNKNNLAGVSMAIIGFEVDSEAAFERGITEWFDAFTFILQSSWNALILTLTTAAVTIIAVIFNLTPVGAIITAISLLVTAAFEAFWAIWAPADLIIEDFKGFSEIDLAALTNPTFPKPPVVKFRTSNDIKVEIEPLTKNVQYKELRKYVSDREGSHYQIRLRYNRF